MKLTDNLYEVVHNENSSFRIKLADSEHCVFKAHFPDYPILPGFLQIDIAQELLNKEFKALKKVKFIQPVEPSMVLDYLIDGSKIIIKSDSTKISEIIYE